MSPRNPITIAVGRALGRVETVNDWPRVVQLLLGRFGVEDTDYLCVDQRGYVCRGDRDVLRAARAGAFPIVVYEYRPREATGAHT